MKKLLRARAENPQRYHVLRGMADRIDIDRSDLLDILAEPRLVAKRLAVLALGVILGAALPGVGTWNYYQKKGANATGRGYSAINLGDACCGCCIPVTPLVLGIAGGVIALSKYKSKREERYIKLMHEARANGYRVGEYFYAGHLEDPLFVPPINLPERRRLKQPSTLSL